MTDDGERLLALQLVLLYVSSPTTFTKRLGKAVTDIRKHLPGVDKEVAEIVKLLHLEKA